MARVKIRTYGGADELELEAAAEALRPGPGEVLGDVEAAGVNYIDVMQRQGVIKLPLPYTPGLEGVGTVRVASEGTHEALAAGQRVAWVNVAGSYASQLVVPAAQAIPVPDTFSTSQALLF